MYDFASSGYTTVVITAVFNAYFVAVVGGVALGNARLDGDVVPVLRADRPHGPAPRRHRRRLRLEEAGLLVATTLACVGATTLLWFAGSGTPGLTVAAVIVSSWASAPART